jgi:hypothetical protein
LKKYTRKKYTAKQVTHLKKKTQKEFDKDSQEEQDWALKYHLCYKTNGLLDIGKIHPICDFDP